MKEKDTLTEKIIGCCFRVHSELGPGFIEKIYHNALKLDFKQEGIRYHTEKAFKVHYQEMFIGNFKADLIIEDEVIVELKAVTGKLPAIFEAQLLSYLKASGIKIGLLVNFGNRRCQVKRLVF